MKQREGRIPILTYQGIPLWRDDRVIKGVVQVVSAIIVVGFLYFFISNILTAAENRGLALGFDFLSEAAGFPIGESVFIQYDPSMSFGQAFAVGLLNTLKVSLIGVVFATLVGIIVGVARLSTNWLLRSIAGVYIEIVRNVPLLVLLFFIFFGVFQQLPDVQNSFAIGDLIFLNQRGVYMAWYLTTGSTVTWAIILAAAFILAMIAFVILGSYQVRTGRSTYPGWIALGILIGLPIIGWFILPEQPLNLDLPVLGKFNFVGGLTLTTQFTALLIGLIFYTGAFIAEIVRAGIQAVSKGQVEAAKSIGLKPMQSLRLVIFPQALRVVIPPLISQYLNLTKNSSLAIAIGYPDMFAVGRIMINQAGRAVPVFIMIMVTYLLLSLTYSVILNLYNRRIAFVER
ncbi:MAG: ABC transporter permease subunit [Anaerolineae bacterium]|nr:MAG: ABC transporter permease subunit [Anaerolineae bacterium]